MKIINSYCFILIALLIHNIVQAQKVPKQNRASVAQAEFGDLGNGQFINPILPGEYPDPSILRDGADFYMTHTSLNNYPGLIILHSRDLVNWAPVGSALNKYIGEIWAPDLVKYKDKYYIYFPSRETGTNMVVTASQPGGPWSDPIDLKVGGIDPSHIVGEDGKRYLFLSQGMIAPLADDGLSVTAPPKKVFNGWKYPEDWLVECYCLESPKPFKRGTYYYMVSAQGGTGGPATSHMATIARSKSVFGPWEESPYNPLVHTSSAKEQWWSKGHATLVDAPDGSWWAIYHAYKRGLQSRGRATILQQIVWTKDGWPQINIKGDLTKAAQKIAVEQRDNYLKKNMSFKELWDNHLWQFYNEYNLSRFKFSGDTLTLKAEGSSPADSHPLLYNPVYDNYSASIKLSLSDSVNAGLMIFYSEKFYIGVEVRGHQLIYNMNGNKQVLKDIPSNDAVYFKVINQHDAALFLYSLDGKQWTKVSDAKDISVYNNSLFADFRSQKIALFSYGSGSTMFSGFHFEKRQSK